MENLFDGIPAEIPAEIFEVLLDAKNFRLERIVSGGQATPPGEWYDQESHEWVVLLTGAAGLRFEAEPGLRVLRPGDFLLIPAHCRHRVEWTDPARATVWLALHYQP
jgi:cupin 2 domain-containing protein